MALVIREGDPTTTGGIVVAGSSTFTVNYRQAARMTDPVWCPACRSMGFIAEGVPSAIHQNLLIALEGHAVHCGCPPGSNRLIATDSRLDIGESGGVHRVSPAMAASAQAATHEWARALRSGSFANAYTSGIPRHEVRGLAPAGCVFAKSCNVPPGSTEAGTATEPAGNFGRVSVLGTVDSTAAAGSVALGRVAGQSALEGLGNWSLRGAGAAAGTAASTLLLALWPSDTGDGTRYSEDELRHLSTAATRVRFQFRRDAEGAVQVYGLHTGNGSVPVIEARWNDGKRAMEAQLGGVTIIWTPNEGPQVNAPTTYPGITEALDTLLVHPIAEGQDSLITHYPGQDAEDITWQDTIITFPVDSGVPPLYLVFAKPAVKPLEVDIYGAFDRRPRNGLHVDHMPSQAAIRRYLEGIAPDLEVEEIEQLLKNVASIAVPARVHQKYSETYGWRNTKVKQALDSGNLRAAVDSNFNAIKPYLLEEGYSEGDIEKAREQMHQINTEQGWY